MTTATWTSAPDIRGRDLVWIAALGVAGLVILFGIAWFLISLDTGPSIPASAPEFDTWPKQTAREFWAEYVAVGAFYAYIVLVLYAVLVRRQRQSWRDMGFRAFDAKWLAVTIALGGLLIIFGEWITGVLGLSEQAETFSRSLFAPENANALTAAVELLLTGPATAVIEEVCFRGLLHRWIRQNLGRILGVSLSAAIFSIIHFSFIDPGGLLGWYWTAEIFLIGAALALLYEWSGSLWPPILLHTANNIVVVSLVYLSA